MPGRPLVAKDAETLHNPRSCFSQAQSAPPEEEQAKEKRQSKQLCVHHLSFQPYLLFILYHNPLICQGGSLTVIVRWLVEIGFKMG